MTNTNRLDEVTRVILFLTVAGWFPHARFESKVFSNAMVHNTSQQSTVIETLSESRTIGGW
jgi:hypothetical protein